VSHLGRQQIATSTRASKPFFGSQQRRSRPASNSPDRVKTRARGAPAPRMALREARSGGDPRVRPPLWGSKWERDWRIQGSSHSLSLEPWTPAPHRRCGDDTRTPAHVCLRHSAGRPQVLGLRLTRLACGKLEMPCPPECARMGVALPEPPGSCPSQARGPTGILREAARARGRWAAATQHGAGP
jgi:hypothetical protein